MPKRLKMNPPKDLNQLARYIVEVTTAEPELPPKPRPPKGLSDYMSKLGKRGGTISGRNRMTSLSDEQRREIASKAARAMWAKRRKKAR
jgi:hypothetical protein